MVCELSNILKRCLGRRVSDLSTYLKTVLSKLKYKTSDRHGIFFFFFLRKNVEILITSGIVSVKSEDDRRTGANQNRRAEDGRGPAVLF